MENGTFLVQFGVTCVHDGLQLPDEIADKLVVDVKGVALHLIEDY